MITGKDLIGQLEGFPIQVVELMLKRQVQQGNPENVRIFQKYRSSDRTMGGFTWEGTPEGGDFWCEVIHNHNFKLFFEKYPELSNEVWIKGVNGKGKEVIAELKKRGGINRHRLEGNRNDLIYYVEQYTNTIRCAHDNVSESGVLKKVYAEIIIPEPVLEVTIEEVAQKFGVSRIKIKNK